MGLYLQLVDVLRASPPEEGCSRLPVHHGQGVELVKNAVPQLGALLLRERGDRLRRRGNDCFGLLYAVLQQPAWQTRSVRGIWLAVQIFAALWPSVEGAKCGVTGWVMGLRTGLASCMLRWSSLHEHHLLCQGLEDAWTGEGTSERGER